MINHNSILFALLIPFLNLISLSGCAKNSGKLTGYYPAYHARFQSPENIPWSIYSQLSFSFASPHLDGSFTYPPGLDAQKFNVLAPRFVKEAKQHKVKACISYGGWTGSRDFSKMVANEPNRVKYAKMLIDYSKKFEFECMDIDWEFPNAAGIGCNSFDKSDVELRKQWPKATYTAAFAVGGLIGASGGLATQEETKLLIENLDTVKMMVYDVFGVYSKTTGPLSPIRGTCAPENPASVESSLVAFTKMGFKSNQLSLGLAGYGRSYELLSPTIVPRKVVNYLSYFYQNHTGKAPEGGKTDDPQMIDVCGVDTPRAGIWLVKELIEKGYLSEDQSKGQNGYKRTKDDCSGQSFLTNGKYFFSYDDKDSMIAKINYIKKKNIHQAYVFDTLGHPDAILKSVNDALA
ncbi:hypothetical protein CROQUDRAFT_106169 [Cronartium quercuum f. sp. fusiforme G11]|uniref:GH18 domain-containing protein n=1 Tax=Cronartium quercuum f. sp. fusiforme G11 TaxID=708437 RepID=A0A9P6NKV5_9BASI|nr:hypothetical protein CROQUDRAFT_106169 [Cronartium quercuum f. sp. fusiforme G11]